MKSALVILFEECEAIEAMITMNILRRGNVTVTTYSINEKKYVTGSYNVTFQVDAESLPQQDFDAIIIPGGRGIANIRHNKFLENLIKKQYESGKLIAAICSSPIILLDIGILDKHRYTAHFSLIEELKDAKIHEPVVVDGNVITGRDIYVAISFGLAILEYFTSVDEVRTIAQQLMCDC